MKKVVLLLIILIFLTGCCIFNLGNFVLPDDLDFIALIEELDTPCKICEYMKCNFSFEDHAIKSLSPYDLFLYGKGDCNDFATFAMFIANYHEYITYEIIISLTPLTKHAIAVYEEEKGYTFSDLGDYFDYETLQESLIDIVNLDFNYKWIKYVVYDYNMNIIERGYNK